MSRVRHDALAILVAVAIAWFITPWARIGWSLVAVPESFSTEILWLDYVFLSIWIFEFSWAALFGIFLARTLRSDGALWWSLALGLGLALMHFVFSRNGFGPSAPLSIYFWVYGQYVVPVIGAVLGAWATERYWPRAENILVDAA